SISFSRNELLSGTLQRVDNIKISRGEENIFIWCFFLAIVQLVMDKVESYRWVKYIYVDDPISSLDDNNVIAVASHLAQLMSGNDLKVIVSSHHTLFFNVLCNEINRAEQLFLQKNISSGIYILKDTTKTPFFHHVALLMELKKASDSGELYTYHFNILRNILEKTASFHGFAHFSACIRKGADEDEPVYTRIINLLSHGNYSLFDPKEMVDENKEYFKNILNNFLEDYNFNKKLFGES
ncbi:MAG: AAA family ATPase, partial [Trichococcus flocculiformis]